MEKLFWNRYVEFTSELQVAALQEHLRRTAMWMHHYKQQEYLPYLKVEDIPGLIFNQDFVDLWSALLKDRTYNQWRKATIQQFIFWRSILNPEVLPSGLPDAFAAFYYYCGTGGEFRWDHSGMVEFEGGGIYLEPMDYYLKHPPFVGSFTY